MFCIYMEVFYNGKLMKDGDFLKVSETQKEPKIKINVNANDLYTLILFDPDAVGGTHIHLSIINITNNDIKTGNIIIPYKGPAPPPGTGKHRYIFGLYKQDREIFSEPLNERQIEIDNLKNKLNLYVKPIFETKFISQNESGGRKRRKTRRRKNKKLKITRRR